MLGDPNLHRQNTRIVEPIWDDLRAPATSIKAGPAAVLPNWDETNLGWLLDGTRTETIIAVFQTEHTYREGTVLIPHIHWRATTNNAGNVYWQLEYVWNKTGDVQAGFTTINLTTAVSGAALTLQLSDFAAIAYAGADIFSMIKCKLSRLGGHVNDTYNGDDVLLEEFDLHFQKDALGSVLDNSKWG